MKQMQCRAAAAAMMLMCSICTAGMPAAAEDGKADVLDQIKFTNTAYSVYSDSLTQSVDEMGRLFTESCYTSVRSQEELQQFISEFLKEEPCKEFLAKYPESFFDDYSLMLCTYLDPTHGRLTGHKLQSACIENEVITFGYTSNFGASVCKTYGFEIMQAAVPIKLFCSGGCDWFGTETLDPGLIRFDFRDADTGEVLNLPDIAETTYIQPTIAYYDAESGYYIYADLASISCNFDWFWDASQYMDADILDFSLSERNLPPGWTLPEDYRTVTKYDNGSMDVIFRLRSDIPEAGMLRVWLKDADNGSLIVSRNKDGEFGSISTDIRFDDPVYGSIGTGPVLMLGANPCAQKFDLLFGGDYYAYRLSEWGLPRGYSCDAVYANGVSIPEGAVEATRYENGSADLVFYLKFTPTGDVNANDATELSDAVSVQKWLLGEPESLADWKAADYNNDNKLNAVDLSLFLRAMQTKQ